MTVHIAFTIPAVMDVLSLYITFSVVCSVVLLLGAFLLLGDGLIFPLVI